jgi:hypothetical protein
MPSVESSTRIEYSKMRRDGSDRIPRQDERRRRADQRQDLQEAGEVVDDEAAAEGRELAGRQQQLPARRSRPARKREPLTSRVVRCSPR